ncbi:MAG: hypothetical protein KF729_24510 [Sandaracinaceae bacterium]|nr:hypothetical protein [Sandaracinaceae bacterium]
MLLGDELLTDEAIAAAIWRIRERTEHEVSAVFARLAADLEAAEASPELAALARRCADDEVRHAAHCRRIVDALAPGLPPLSPDRGVVLGPRDASAARRALYASVALGCVTESLSTALLIEMRPHATTPEVSEGLDAILRDEVRHSRLGWAHLAIEAARGDVSWLAPSIPAMIEAARAAEPTPGGGEPRDLRCYGILGAGDVARVADAVVETTILPGLARYGIAGAGR